MKDHGEATEPHSRLLRCSLCVGETRAYWSHVDPADPRGSSVAAFNESWFGAKSEAWTTELLANMRVRFDAYPKSLRALARWRTMSPDTRRVICHFHLQLTDPLYRAFTGEHLPARRDALRATVHRQSVIQWAAEHGLQRWAMKTRLQFASRLLSCALAAGLLRGKQDPREAVLPRVPDPALEYVLYALRDLRFEGTLVQNPYLASLGLIGGNISDRLRTLASLEFRQIGDVHEMHWRFPDLEAWAASQADRLEPDAADDRSQAADEVRP